MSTVQWVSRILKERPSRGQGLHRWLLRASIGLRRYGLPDHRIIAMLADTCAGEPIRAGEIEDAVARSIDCMVDVATASARTPYTPPTFPRRATTAKWPDLDTVLRNQIIAANACTVADLAEASPVHFQDETPHTDAIVRRLFPGNPLLCIAGSLERSVTRPLAALRTLALYQFIVPSPMFAPTGLTKTGRESARCLGNTGPRRYLVIEQDRGAPDEQAAIIGHLSDLAPLVLVVHSGGKSLHAWFSCLGQPEASVYKFFVHACRLGADPATWTRCQLVRMPDGTRRFDGARFGRQSVLFWNPEATPCA